MSLYFLLLLIFFSSESKLSKINLQIHKYQYIFRINTILPGFIETPMVQTVPDKVKNLISKQISLKRLGKPEGKIKSYLYFFSE